MMRFTVLFLLTLFYAFGINAQDTNKRNEIAGSAYLENMGYNFLERICDEAGGRLAGTTDNKKAMNILGKELVKLGLEPHRETFSMPGWHRGDDRIMMSSPSAREIRAAALGFTDKTPEFETGMIYAEYGFKEDYDSIDAKGKIVLVTQEKPPKKHQLLRYEAIDIAAEKGAKAILFINNKPGGMLLAGVSNFLGRPSAIPAYTITYEDGTRMRRLLERNIPVTLKIRTESACSPEMESANTVVTFKGKSPVKIVLGAHFDSWDLGTGAVDNGYGTAILFDIARLLKKYDKDNYFTIELVWFNAEELGLWGSRRYVEQHSTDSTLMMINMDMTGMPTGFNVMGFDEFLPFFRNFNRSMDGFELTVLQSSPWINSDQYYFMLAGIPAVTIPAHLGKDMGHYYHDFGDTFDKADKKYLSNAAAVIAILTTELAADRDLHYIRYNRKKVEKLFISHDLDKKLKRQDMWPFSD